MQSLSWNCLIIKNAFHDQLGISTIYTRLNPVTAGTISNSDIKMLQKTDVLIVHYP